YCRDLRGLMRYLADKVSVGNLCLRCNGRGRAFASLAAVRRHMVDCGHCSIDYETEEARAELADFYDFSATWPAGGAGADDDADGDAEDEATLARLRPYVAEDTMELVLPSGVRLGHRLLHRYYRQHFPPSRFADDDDGADGERALPAPGDW